MVWFNLLPVHFFERFQLIITQEVNFDQEVPGWTKDKQVQVTKKGTWKNLKFFSVFCGVVLYVALYLLFAWGLFICNLFACMGRA